jgi:filamentous hemagglutinin
MWDAYGYNAEDYDAGTGMSYLRARYLDIAMGGFITEDTYKGNIFNPASLNLRVYVEGNPVAYTDPSGNMKCDGIQAVLGKLSSLLLGLTAGFFGSSIVPVITTLYGLIEKSITGDNRGAQIMLDNFYNNLHKFATDESWYAVGKVIGDAVAFVAAVQAFIQGASAIAAAVVITIGATAGGGAAGAIISVAINVPLALVGVLEMGLAAGVLVTATGNFSSDFDALNKGGSSNQIGNFDKVKDNYLKGKGIDAHEVKEGALGTDKNLSQYDIYVDKGTGELYVFRKGGVGEGIPTGEFIK